MPVFLFWYPQHNGCPSDEFRSPPYSRHKALEFFDRKLHLTNFYGLLGIMVALQPSPQPVNPISTRAGYNQAAPLAIAHILYGKDVRIAEVLVPLEDMAVENLGFSLKAINEPPQLVIVLLVVRAGFQGAEFYEQSHGISPTTPLSAWEGPLIYKCWRNGCRVCPVGRTQRFM